MQIVIDRRVGRVLATIGRPAEAAPRFERVRVRAQALRSGPNGPATRNQLLMTTIDLAQIRAAARDPQALALAREATAALAGTPVSPPTVAATLQADLGRVWLARATALADESTRLWTAVALPAALEPQRAAALAALAADRARATALTRP